MKSGENPSAVSERMWKGRPLLQEQQFILTCTVCHVLVSDSCCSLKENLWVKLPATSQKRAFSSAVSSQCEPVTQALIPAARLICVGERKFCQVPESLVQTALKSSTSGSVAHVPPLLRGCWYLCFTVCQRIT